MRKINQHKVTYYKEWGAFWTFVTIMFLLWCCHMGRVNSLKGEDPVSVTFPVAQKSIELVATAKPITEKEIMQTKVKQYFPRSYKKMDAIIMAEGGWSMNKKNYNCFYQGKWLQDKKGKWYANITNPNPVDHAGKGIISTSCQKQADYKMAWSVDCFLLQKNYIGRNSCPKNVTLDEHLAEVAHMTTTTKEQDGLNIFSSHKLGNDLAYQK